MFGDTTTLPGFFNITMAKETFYFSHDYDTRSDEKIKCLIRRHKMAGYGIFWALVEDLYSNANALQADYEGIAYDLRTDEDLVKSVINDFGLFEVKDGIFSSKSVSYRLNQREHKSQNARESANYRWKNANALRTHNNSNANEMQTHSDGNAIKESKVKENKIKRKGFKFSDDFEYVIFTDGEKQALGKQQKDLAKMGGISPLLIIEGSIY